MRYLLLAFALTGCSKAEVVDREPADRTPLSAPCDDTDPLRCHLPWPSNTFTVAADTATGLRLDIDAAELPVADRPDYLNIADGFSRITGVTAAFTGGIDESSLSWDPASSLDPEAPVQVLLAQHDSPDFGRRYAFRTELVDVSTVEHTRHLVVGRPVEVLPPASDCVFVVLDSIGATEEVPRGVLLAVGLAEPRDDGEAALVGWHAPTRATLAAANIAPERVARVSMFTTRSHHDTTRRVHAMIDVLDGAVDGLGIEVDSINFTSIESIDLLVRGRLTNAPNFVDADGRLVLDDDGLPTITGATAIEFRLMIPAGEGDYHIVLYGHGTGGNVSDSSFDSDLGEQGIAKLNLRYDGWTDEDFIDTLLGFRTFLDGTERSTAGLMQAVAGGTVLLTALDGVLGDMVALDELDGQANPAAGRRPLTDSVAWVGGSMGGTMGAVVVSAEPRLQTAVLNVPGAGWTHMVPHSVLYSSGMESILLEQYPELLDVQIGMIMAQGAWDDVDGAVWAEEALDAGGAFLLQESIGDPVLPNLGTDLLANSLQAVQLDPSLADITGLEHGTTANSGAALTQFQVPDTGAYDVHGFAARDTPAGRAAFGQIELFLTSAWEGTPIMTHPDGCQSTPDGTCDFSDAWE
jgi:hypothetical protein